MIELPEYQIFSILRQGETEPIGPYSQNEIVELLREGDVGKDDLVYYPELSEWTPLSEVFEVHENIVNFEDHGQDPEYVEQAFNYISQNSEEGESVYYIAVQNYPAVSLTTAVRLKAPQSLVLTDRRFCYVKPKLIGDIIEFEAYSLDEIVAVASKIKSTDASEGVFCVVLSSGEQIETDKIPVAQLGYLKNLTESRINAKRQEG